MGSVFLLWHTNNRLNPVVLGLNLVCSLQLLVSNCLLNCEVFSFANYFSHACHKQNLEAVLCRSSSRLNPELRQQNGKSSWPFYGAQFLQQVGLRGWWLQRAGSKDLVAAPGEPEAVEIPGNVTCGTRLSSSWMASLFVQHRAGWLGKEQLLHHLPRPEFQVTLSMNYENPCPGVGCAGNVSGEEQTPLTRLGHSSFSCSLGLCCVFYMFTGAALELCHSKKKTCPSPHFAHCVHKKKL